MNPDTVVVDLAKLVFKRLKETNKKLMFVESCTGGMGAGLLVAHCPGISQFLHGSLVVYTIEAKSQWLQIPITTLQVIGTESAHCAEEIGVAAAWKNNVNIVSIVGDLSKAPYEIHMYHIDATNTIGSSRVHQIKTITLSNDNRQNRQLRMKEALVHLYLYILECL